MRSADKVEGLLVAHNEQWFDVKTMAERAGVSESTVRRAYKTLGHKEGIEFRVLSGRMQASYSAPAVILSGRRWFRRRNK